jgi:hypothetical protein
MTAPLVEWPAVYPWGLFGKGLDEPTFTRRYRHRLHRLTPRIMRELTELREGYGDMVLLCHEDLTRPGPASGVTAPSWAGSWPSCSARRSRRWSPPAPDHVVADGLL